MMRGAKFGSSIVRISNSRFVIVMIKTLFPWGLDLPRPPNFPTLIRLKTAVGIPQTISRLAVRFSSKFSLINKVFACNRDFMTRLPDKSFFSLSIVLFNWN